MQTQEIQQNQAFNESDVVIVPPLEENIPIPKNVREALPNLSNQEELEMMANTIKLLADLNGEDINPTVEDIDEAKMIAKQMIEHPNNKLQLKKYKNATLASLAGMVAELDAQVVDELKDLKTFVVNGLIREATTADKPKERITALRAIGDIDGVDAFKKHTEVVHKNMSMDDIEDRLKTLVTKLQKRLEEKNVEGETVNNGE